MSAEIIDGRVIAQNLRQQISEEVAKLHEQTGTIPGLHVILIGDDPASQVYVQNKQKAADSVGIRSTVERYPDDVSHQKIIDRLKELREDPRVHGILVQTPVPPQIDFDEVVETIGPDKDVDGFHPYNLGMLASGNPRLIACTPLGIMHMLHYAGVEIRGRHAVVVGRSRTVGRPMAMLLLNENATVTTAHSQTRDLGEMTRQADILVVAVGRPRTVRGDMIKPGAVVIDVGINRVEGSLVGDVDFESARNVAGRITPVPGGVGPMTIATLLQNTYRVAAGEWQ